MLKKGSCPTHMHTHKSDYKTCLTDNTMTNIYTANSFDLFSFSWRVCTHTHTQCEQWLTTFWSWNTCWSHGSNVSWRLNIYCRFLQSHDLDNNHCTEHTPGSCWQRRMQRCWRGGKKKLGNKYTHQQDNKPTKTNSVWIRTFKGLTDFWRSILILVQCVTLHFALICSSSLWRFFSPLFQLVDAQLSAD